MEQSLAIDGRKSRTVRVNVNPAADFREVIHVFDAIEIPRTTAGTDNIRFSILELLNNSIRAHREKQVSKDILVDLTVTDGKLFISVRDFGGGFDPTLLPYPLEADLSALDINAPVFLEYRQKNDFKRFGMGIYLAKRTFERFRLIFLDGKDNPVTWAPGRVSCTLIKAEISVQEAHDGH